jgi:hypothetical protein
VVLVRARFDVGCTENWSGVLRGSAALAAKSEDWGVGGGVDEVVVADLRMGLAGPRMNEGKKRRLTLKSALPEESVTSCLLRVRVVERRALY